MAGGTLVVADMTDPMLAPAEANGVFQVLLEQFRLKKVDCGKVRKTLSWPRSWANFSLSHPCLYFHGDTSIGPIEHLLSLQVVVCDEAHKYFVPKDGKAKGGDGLSSPGR